MTGQGVEINTSTTQRPEKKKKKAETKNYSTSYCVHSPIQEAFNGALHLYHLLGTVTGDEPLQWVRQ